MQKLFFLLNSFDVEFRKHLATYRAASEISSGWNELFFWGDQ